MRLADFTDFFGITEKASKKASEAEQREKPAPLGPKEVYLSWEALSRSESKFLTVQMTRALLMVAIFVGALLIVMQEVFLIFFVASVVFIAYVLSKVPPEKVRYEISSYGVGYGDRLYYWEELKQFFFIEDSGLTILVIDTTLGLPGRVFITIEKGKRDKIKSYLEGKLHYIEEAPKTVFDNLATSLIARFRS